MPNSNVVVEGGIPLIGTVQISGSKNSCIKLIYAAMFSNEDVVIENAPRIPTIERELDIIRSIGGTAEWLGKNTLLLNGSTIESYKVPFKLAQRNRTVFLLSGVLLYRFGKAFIPKMKEEDIKISPINRFLDTWDSLGVIYAEDDNYYMLSGENLKSASINFKYPTQMGTDLAMIMSSFIDGDTFISNASQDPEVDELLDFLKAIGVSITRQEPTKIKIHGTNIFKGVNWSLSYDKTEVVTFAVATLITNGNVLIKGVNRESLTSFSHFLMKIGARFEFEDDALKVWHSGEHLIPITANITPYPGLVPDWQPLLSLLMSKGDGQSNIYDQVYTDRFDYIKDLNRMDARIDMVKPSDIGKTFNTQDDSYDIKKLGEPSTVIQINGPVKLKAEKLDIQSGRFGAVLLVAALAADGKSILFNFDKLENWFEDIIQKLQNLGAKIRYVTSD